jgi:hypothetical protein
MLHSNLDKHLRYSSLALVSLSNNLAHPVLSNWLQVLQIDPLPAACLDRSGTVYHCLDGHLVFCTRVDVINAYNGTLLLVFLSHLDGSKIVVDLLSLLLIGFHVLPVNRQRRYHSLYLN